MLKYNKAKQFMSIYTIFYVNVLNVFDQNEYSLIRLDSAVACS